MERNEISEHEVRFYRAAKEARPAWLTSKELARRARIAERTSRAFATKFVNLGLFDVEELFPGHRYRLASKPDKRNASYVGRLERATDIFMPVEQPTRL